MKPQPWSFDHLLNTPPDNQPPESSEENKSSPFQEGVDPLEKELEGPKTPEARDTPTVESPTATLFGRAWPDPESDTYSPGPADTLISPAEWLSGKSPSRYGTEVLAPATPANHNVLSYEDHANTSPVVESPLLLNPISVDGNGNPPHQDKSFAESEDKEQASAPEAQALSIDQHDNAEFGYDMSQTLIDIQDDSQYQTPPTGNHAATFDSKTLTLSSPPKSHAFFAKKRTPSLQDTPSPTEVRYLGMPGVRKWLSRDNTPEPSQAQKDKATPDDQDISADEVPAAVPVEEQYPVPGQWIEPDNPSRKESRFLRKLNTETDEGKTSSSQKKEKGEKHRGLDRATRPVRSHGSTSQTSRRKDKSGKSEVSRSRMKKEYEEVAIGFSPEYRPDKSFQRVEVNGRQQIFVHLPKTTVKIPPDVPTNWNPSSGVPLADKWPEKEALERMTPEQEEVRKEALRQELELERLEREHLERKRREEEEDEERKLWQAIKEKASAIEAQRDKDERIALLKQTGMNSAWTAYWEQKEKDEALTEKKRQEEEAEVKRMERIADLSEQMDEIHKKRVVARAKALAKRVMQEGLKMRVRCLERGNSPELAMECADAYTEYVMEQIFVNLMERGDLARFED